MRIAAVALLATVIAACSGPHRTELGDRRRNSPPITQFRATSTSTTASSPKRTDATTSTSTTAPAPPASRILHAAPATSTSRPAPTPTSTSTSSTAPAGPPAPVLLAVGDIASCASSGDEATAALLDHLDGQILTLGDHAYEHGTTSEFANCYDPTWGRHERRTHPTRGNHDVATSNGAPYTTYFGGVARWYSWDLAGWHLIALDSNTPSDPAQLQWLHDDLAAHITATCTLAYWHHPRYSSGTHGSSTAVAPLWDALASAHADVVLQGHDHDYERFAPIDGIRSFVVGTGGRSHYTFTKPPLQQTEVRDDTSFGVLELTLHATSYEWRFVAATGMFADTSHPAPEGDSGEGSCQ